MLRMYSLLLLMIIGFSSSAQSLENENTITYLKANILFDSGRYDEAVKMYNQVLNEDNKHAQAYLMRAKAKYELGAEKGSKNDIISFIELAGVQKDVVKLMAKVEFKLENYKAAENYSNTAIELDPFDAEQYYVSGLIAYALKDKNEACEHWSKAAELGDDKARKMLEEQCSIRIKLDDITKSKPDMDAPSKKRSDIEIDDIEDNNPIDDIPSTRIEESNKDAVQEIEIDRELTLVFGNGLGERKVESHPDIFLLSNAPGNVVIDICVDREGNVSTAELNERLSSLTRTGIISMALRKAKEVKFYPSIREEQCGFVIFMIEK